MTTQDQAGAAQPPGETAAAPSAITARGSNSDGTTIALEVDGINLERALIDFEIANARVIDVTARLTDLSRDLLATRAELGLARLRIAELEAAAEELAVVKSSAAYRAARMLGDSRARMLRR